MENKNENTIKINDITANIMLDECDKLKEHATIEDQYTLNVVRNMLNHFVVRTEIEDDPLISDPVCKRINNYDYALPTTRELQKAFIPLVKRMVDFVFLYGGMIRPEAQASLVDLLAKISSLNILEIDDSLELFHYINTFKGCEEVDLLSIHKHSQAQLNEIKTKIMEELKNEK